MENHEKTGEQRAFVTIETLSLFCHQDHCYYHGAVRGFPGSSVSLSTCSGLRWAPKGTILVSVELLFCFLMNVLIPGFEMLMQSLKAFSLFEKKENAVSGFPVMLFLSCCPSLSIPFRGSVALGTFLGWQCSETLQSCFAAANSCAVLRPLH